MKYLKLYENFDSVSIKDLEVKESTIPNSGKGLFTLVDIPRYKQIVEYAGKEISREKIKELKSKGKFNGVRSDYLIELSDGRIVDVYNSKSVAKYANDAEFGGGKNNSKIQEYEDGKIWLVSTKKIKAGEEIFCSYGPEYWESWKKEQNLI
jgi:SET domain-containing protein